LVWFSWYWYAWSFSNAGTLVSTEEIRV
jgi:hypothetical protein